jgi:hypothetical protein
MSRVRTPPHASATHKGELSAEQIVVVGRALAANVSKILALIQTLSAFTPCKECPRCPLVVVDGHQLIESGNAEDLPHSRLRTQEYRFGPTAVQRLGNGQKHPQTEGGKKGDFRHVQKERLCPWDRVTGKL